MAGESMRFRNPAGHAGLLHNLVSLANALAGFFESRIGLFARESKGALLHLLLLAGAVVAALLLLVLGFMFLMVSAIFGIAHATGVSWLWIALVAAGLHFLLALGCGLFAERQLTKPMFEASVAELKRDREWLKNIRSEKTNPRTKAGDRALARPPGARPGEDCVTNSIFRSSFGSRFSAMRGCGFPPRC